ncbi:MAG: selenium-binding protein [Chloroflexi bacterium]|nr:selenium-binding protein [Chloroflexota bacterium]
MTNHHDHRATGPGYASPQDAIRNAPREEVVYVAGLYGGTGTQEPDFLAVVDVHPDSDTYSQIIHRTSMPNVGDELHHYGWQACSSAHTCNHISRDHLVVPGFRSSRIHILNVSADPRKPEMAKLIEPEEIAAKTGYTRPHTVHCMPGDIITISALGDREGNLPGGFIVLDATTFEVLGRWEEDKGDQQMMYDFWYQPRKNFMLSSEWAAPNTFEPGFDLADVSAGKYGHRLHVWDLERRTHQQTIDLADQGLVPLEVRWLHDPEAEEGFVAATLSSTIWHVHKNGTWTADKVVEVETIDLESFPIPVPGLITDQVISMDDRYLYFSNWFHGDLRQYDISDPANPRQAGRLWLGGLEKKGRHGDQVLDGGPQMLQLSMDGTRLYVTNSLYSTWDNQFYPDLQSWLLKVDIAEDGAMSLDERFFVDFSALRGRPRAHEIHLPGGDVTTEIFS